ncbi:MAG: nicotinamide-nucleotide amidohydrolase family protein [Parachlamydiales bacterium]|jgi:nicotinamide-nucleotide amidase
MRLELVAIGDELLKGGVVNTNLFFLSRALSFLGYEVKGQTVIGDERIEEGLKTVWTRSDVVIVTGGLGPTLDDKTKKAVGLLLQKKLVVDQKVKKRLLKRGLQGAVLESLSKKPQGALVLPNFCGSAPGLVMLKPKGALILLPGVPEEMEALFDQAVAPFLKKHFPLKKRFFQEEIQLCQISEAEVDPQLRKFKLKRPDLRIGIYPHLATLRVVFSLESSHEKKARALLSGFKKKLEKAFFPYVFQAQSGDLAEALKDIFVQKKLTLALAESCSGGALGAALTSVPGASKYFLGSLVTYANELKTSLLNVRPKTIQKYGAVSLETAEEMLQGIFLTTTADFGIALSGIAGPGGGTRLKPAGTLCLAYGLRGKKAQLKKLFFPFERKLFVKYAVSFALSLLWVKIKAL